MKKILMLLLTLAMLLSLVSVLPACNEEEVASTPTHYHSSSSPAASGKAYGSNDYQPL